MKSVILLVLWTAMLVGALLVIHRPAHAEGLVYTAADTIAAIDQASLEIGAPWQWLYRVVDCETGHTFNPYAIGDHGTSFGPVQLHRGGGELRRFYDWQYTDPFDPYQSVRFLAQEFTFGRGAAWSCA